MNEMLDRKEENVAELLRAGYPAEGRLDASLRAGSYGRLVQALHARPAFPPVVLFFICLAFLVLELLAAAMASGFLSDQANGLLTLVAGGMIALNLLCLPVASILIVNKRRKNAKPNL